MAYFARNDEDRKLDDQIRDTIKASKTKSHMALYLQGQEELNLLRRIILHQEDFEEELRTIYQLLNKKEELRETYNIVIEEDDAANTILKEINNLRMKVDDMIQYICESENFHDDMNDYVKISNLHKDAESLVRMHNATAKWMYEKNPDVNHKKNVLIWDYILCCLSNE